MKLTPWFPPEIKPVRNGIYETRINNCSCNTKGEISNWNGQRWSHQVGKMANKSYLTDFGNCAAQDKLWRGLAKEPK
jgi:hypothetical protein